MVDVTRDYSEYDDGDFLPLSKMFSIGQGRKNPQTPRVSREMADSRVSNWPEKGENGSSGPPSFKTGDIIWAKVSSHSWWPGLIHGSKGSVALVSFFGSGRARFLAESEIFGFEENYLQMLEMAGAKLSNGIRRALTELSRTTALGLSCTCWSSATDGLSVGQIAEVQKRFQPAEMLGFVLDMAVSAWVGDAQTVCAVRAAAQVNAYRRYLSGGQLDVVGEGFQPEDVLDFVLNMAVCAWVTVEEAATMARAAAQINAYRHFVSVGSGWVYLKMLEDSSLGDDFEGNILEMLSDPLSESDEPEDFFSVEEQEEEYEVFEFQEEKQGDAICCMVNSTDFNIPGLPEEFELLRDSQTEDADFDTKENFEMQQSAAIGAPQKSNAELNGTNFLCVRDTSHTAPYGTEFHHELKVSCELVGSELEKLPHPSTDTAKTYQDDTVDVTNDMISEAELSSIVNASVSTSLNTGGSDGLKSCSSYFLSDNFHRTELDQVVHSNLSFKLYKTDPMSLIHEPSACLLKPRNEIRPYLAADFSLKHQSRQMAGINHGVESITLSLHEMLWHLHCLALDPFYLGFSKLKSVCKKLLNFRTSIFQNIPDRLSTIYTSESDKEVEAWEFSGHDKLDINNGADESNRDDKASDTFDSRSEAQLSSPICHDDIEIHESDKASSEALCLPLVSDDGVEFRPSTKVNFTANNGMDESNTADGNPAVKFIARMTFPGDGVCEGFLRKRRFDPAIVSENSVKLYTTQPLLSEAKPNERPLTIQSLNSTGGRTHKIADERNTQSLQEMFWDLKCLALDPFYLALRKLKFVRQLFLIYRTSTFQKIPDLFPTFSASEGSEKIETWQASGYDWLMDISNDASEGNADNKVGDAYESRCKPQLLTPVHFDVIKIHASDKVRSPVPCLPNVSGDGVEFQHSDSACEGVFHKERFDKAMISDISLKLQNTRTFVSEDKPYASPMMMENLNSAGNRTEKISNESNTQSLSQMLWHLHCLALDPFILRPRILNYVREKFMICRTLVFQNIPDLFPTIHTSEVGKKVDDENFQSSAKDNLVGSTVVDKCIIADDSQSMKVLPPSTFPAASVSEGNHQKRSFDQAIVANMVGDKVDKIEDSFSLTDPMCRSRDGICRKRELEHCVCSDASKLYKTRRCSVASICRSWDSCCRKRKLERPVCCDASKLSRLYASPLVKDRSNPIRRVRESWVSKAHTGFSYSLHMKFPKDFNLPSKEELETKFRVFGPLDRTRVFCYTGAAQVVFLHSADAEAAYQYVRRKKVFGQANVAFWLDEYEKFRIGNGNQVFPLSIEGKSTLNLKSCLRRPNVLGKRDAKSGVKFSMGNQLSSFSLTATAVRKNKTSSVCPCNVSREVEMDISVQMLQLLEKCNELVCEIESGLGLESYYSIFTVNSCYIPNLDAMNREG